jgi:phosphotransferase system  glucose/maltose/N-acetylglucosamine-specific IIC component
MGRKLLLLCGILSSLLYIGINILVPMQWTSYSSVSQTVSELSAVGAPTRSLWLWASTPYTFLVIAFAWGVWKSAAGNRSLRVTGKLMIAYGLLGLIWPFAPMHLRETLAAGGATLSDTVHIALGAVTEILFLLALGFSAKALGKGFRFYSYATFAVLLCFGTLTFIDAPKVAKNAPTPLIGVWERINIGVFLLWIIVLALMLLRDRKRAES